MKMKKTILVLVIVFMFCDNAIAFETNLTPRMTLGGQYSDNIDRTPNNAEEDYISSVSPGATLGLRAATAALTIAYDPAYVQYKEHSERDQWRHYATIDGNWHPGRSTIFDLSNRLTISEDPADIRGTSTVTRAPNRYMSNDGTIGMTHHFGREDIFAIGYNQSLFDSETDIGEDSQRLNPFMNFTWWFIENEYGLTLYTDYTRANFQRSDDFDSVSGNLRLRKRYTRNLDAFLQYAYLQTEYEGVSENYKVHNPGIGINYLSGEHTNISMAIGYFMRERERSQNDQGAIFTGTLVTAYRYSRGTISLNADSGYTQDTFATENLGFYVYSGANIRADYGFTRTLRGDIFCAYRYAKYLDTEPNIEDHEMNGGVGVSFQTLSWMRFRLEYAHYDLISNDEIREYKENRVTLTLTLEPSTPFRWI